MSDAPTRDIDVDAAAGPADEEQRPAILIISGMSGAGRSTASNVIEDLGWFVIDNLPPTLIGRVSELAFAPGSSVTKLALVADLRGREFFSTLVGAIEDLRGSRADVRVLFLEADNETLVRRYEETRRVHPAADNAGVLDGIRREREELQELRGLADRIIDTTGLNVHELREQVVAVLGDAEPSRLRIEVITFGFKRGTPREADLLLDVRFLPNPHWVEELRPFDGRNAAVCDYVFSQPAAGPFLEAVQRLFDVTVPGYVAEGKRYLTIAIGCTGGKHRSIAIGERIATYLRETFALPVNVVHRDVGSE